MTTLPIKVPPHSLEAETSVLGCILIDPEAIIKVSDLLQPESFYQHDFQQIYAAMVSLFEKRQPIDAVTLAEELRKNKNLNSIGGAAKIAELSSAVTTAANVVQYAQIVADTAIKRKLISLAGTLSEQAFDAAIEAKDVMDVAEQQVFSLSHTVGTRAFIPIKDTLVESFDRIDELQRSGEALRGLATGFDDLDRMLAGMQRSNLLILAARPGMGKTALALNIAHSVAVMSQKKVGIFSLEMSKEELVDRLLVNQADIDAWKLKTGRLDQQDFLKLSDAMGVLADAHLFIDDTPGLTIFEMRTKARRLMVEQNIDFLIVDYLQLAHGRTMDNRVQEVAEISQGLKNIARELRIPVLGLSQLSRAVESRGEKVPQLSDLRESGAIEQDADVVMFLYRADDDVREAMKLKIAKHRNGPVGDIDLFFRGDRIKFYGMETKRGVINP